MKVRSIKSWATGSWRCSERRSHSRITPCVPATRRCADADRWSRFVGREAEIERLHCAARDTRAGRGQMVALCAEPGVGKSRLVYELINSPVMQGWRILESSSLSYDRMVSWGPIIDVLSQYFEIDDSESPQVVSDKVKAQVLALDSSLESALAPILSLFDVLA
ncbi:MAG: AAA family ATPase, partial [Burkholderiales bacterium]